MQRTTTPSPRILMQPVHLFSTPPPLLPAAAVLLPAEHQLHVQRDAGLFLQPVCGLLHARRRARGRWRTDTERASERTQGVAGPERMFARGQGGWLGFSPPPVEKQAAVTGRKPNTHSHLILDSLPFLFPFLQSSPRRATCPPGCTPTGSRRCTTAAASPRWLRPARGSARTTT